MNSSSSRSGPLVLALLAVLSLFAAVTSASDGVDDAPPPSALLHVVFSINATSGAANVLAAKVVTDNMWTLYANEPRSTAAAASGDYVVALDDDERSQSLLAVSVKEHRGHLGPTFYDHFDADDNDAAAAAADADSAMPEHLHGHATAPLRGHMHLPASPEALETRYVAAMLAVPAKAATNGRRRQGGAAPSTLRLMQRSADGARHQVLLSASLSDVAPAAAVSAERHFAAQATTASSVTKVDIQVRDLTTQPTLVFLSAGYTAAEQNTFNNDVERAIKALSDTSVDADIDATPWPRYASLLNIFSVYQASVQSGASVQVGPGFVCNNTVGTSTSTGSTPSPRVADSTTSPACIATTINNNLGCSYGSPQPRLLSCEYYKVNTLASYAPAADVMIVLVNSGAYGGTGVAGAKAGGSGAAGLAVLSTGADLPFLLVHELNHAMSGLGDEYSYGFSEPDASKYSLPNCNPSSNTALLPWKPWIDAGSADASPSLGCSFDNFYRPTQSSCLMSLKVRSMCAVCRQRTTLAIAKKAFNRPAGIKLTSPRCPPENFQISLQSDQSTTLYINHKFSIFNGNVSVQWTIPRAGSADAIIIGLPSVFIRGSDLPVGLQTITAVVTDNTNYILTSDRSAAPATFLTDTTEFKIQRLADGATANCSTPTTCTSTSGSATTYCGTCTSTCLVDTSTQSTEYLAPTTDSLSQDQGIVEAVAIALVLGGLAIVMGAVIAIICRRSNSPSELLVISNSESILGLVAGVFNFLSFGLTCACIVIMVYYLPRVPVFGLDLFIGVFVFCGIVYITCAVAFCGLVARAVTVDVVAGVLMVICSVGTFVLCAIGFWVVVNSDSDNMISWFRSRWKSNVKDHPDRVCSVQAYLHCSGFDASCFPAPSSWCPANCDVQNRNANACLDVFQLFIHNTLLPIVVVGLVYTFILVTGGSLTVAYGVSIDRLRQTGKGRRSYRNDPRAPVVSITDAELRAVELEFAKADKDRDGKLQGKELIGFLRAVFRDECTAADEAALTSAALGPDGTDHGLSLDEILDIYFPTRTTRPDPRLLTDEEAEDANSPADLVRLQFLKMEDFMQRSGSLSPEQLFHLHEAYIRNNAGSNASDFRDVVSKAAKQHSTSEAARMCQGLTYNDLEGLRCAWVRLHPTVEGPLTEEEIGQFFTLTHDGASFVSQEHFVKWKTMLDVRKTGSIGWPEFCFPFAQRALLRNAEHALMAADQTYELRGQPPFMTREEVAAEYGVAYVTQCFLPFERAIPVARVLAASLPAHARRSKHDQAPIAVTVLNSGGGGDDGFTHADGGFTRGGIGSLEHSVYSPKHH